jgi:putative transposase
VAASPLRKYVDDWDAFLSSRDVVWRTEDIRRAQRTGRPLGSPSFVQNLEKILNRRLRKRKTGPKNVIK